MDEEKFVATYGAYLQMHSCLTLAAALKDESAITHLLKAAEHDPNHRDAVKEILKSNDLLFYDSVRVFCISFAQFISCKPSNDN